MNSTYESKQPDELVECDAAIHRVVPDWNGVFMVTNFRAVYRAGLAAPRQAVPRNPTKAMVDAGTIAWSAQTTYGALHETAARMWRAMYDAAPPPALAQDQSDDDMVICPGCAHQFRAIPVNVQRELREAPVAQPDELVWELREYHGDDGRRAADAIEARDRTIAALNQPVILSEWQQLQKRAEQAEVRAVELIERASNAECDAIISRTRLQAREADLAQAEARAAEIREESSLRYYELVRANQRIEAMRKVIADLLDRYLELATRDEDEQYNVEAESEVIAARAVLGESKS